MRTVEASLPPERDDLRARLSDIATGLRGADAGRGSGLTGLTDRVEALGGSLRVVSRPGDGTHIAVELPLERCEPPPPYGAW